MEEKKLTTASPAEPESCCRHKSTPREEKDLRQLQNRLKRMMGQLGGISKMLEDNRYCGDVLTQLAADACKDAGESALASKAELAGKVGLIMLSLPLFQKIAELAVSLMNGKAVG